MLDASLIAIIAIFSAIMFGVLGFCLSERKASRNNPAPSADQDHAQDMRVARVLFGAIIVGALLALTTMYLVFFRQWA